MTQDVENMREATLTAEAEKAEFTSRVDEQYTSFEDERDQVDRLKAENQDLRQEVEELLKMVGEMTRSRERVKLLLVEALEKLEDQV